MQVPTDPSLSRILQLQDPHHVDHNSGCADGALDLWQEAPENEAEEQNSTQNGEGYAISCIRGAPTTDTVSGGEDQEQNMQIMA